MPDGRRIVLCLQFWHGDQEQACRNARRIADNEPEFRPDVEFCFVHRHDCPEDEPTMLAVSAKFKVSKMRSERRGIGHPHGCNEMWCDLMVRHAPMQIREGAWADVKALYTFEGDAIPIQRNWLQILHEEWAKTEAAGKLLCGKWHDHSPSTTGHINGNAMFAPSIGRWIPSISGCSPRSGWDVEFAPHFSDKWFKSSKFENLYSQRGVPVELLDRLHGEGVAVVHGVKDLTVEEYADRVLLKPGRI